MIVQFTSIVPHPVLLYFATICDDAGNYINLNKTIVLSGCEYPSYDLNVSKLNKVERVDFAYAPLESNLYYYASINLSDFHNLTNELLFGLTTYENIIILDVSIDKATIIARLDCPITSFEIRNSEEICENQCNNVDDFLSIKKLCINHMKQFTFRYQVAFEKRNGEKWEKYEEDEAAPVFDYIEEALYDGTHDKLHDGGLMKYHEAGKPKKLKVQFHVGGDTKDGKERPVQEYSAYFWFEDERIREVFDRFYGAHPDTKTDFIIRIDAAQNKYEVAMYRYGLKEPVVLLEDTYQLIVFRNKFECYRSENYNQQRGAWIW